MPLHRLGVHSLAAMYLLHAAQEPAVTESLSRLRRQHATVLIHRGAAHSRMPTPGGRRLTESRPHTVPRITVIEMLCITVESEHHGRTSKSHRGLVYSSKWQHGGPA